MALPTMDWAVKRDKWRESSGSCALSLVLEIDAFLASIEEYRYTRKSVIVDVGLPTLVAYEEKYLQSHWTSVINHYKIKPDFRLFKYACEWSSRNQVNPNSVFLGTWKIDLNANYHEHLLGRVRETMTYGCFKPFQWLAFFARLGLDKNVEIRSIAGLVVKSDGMPYKIKKGDNSVISDLSLFYNIQNLIETQLNIANLRASLNLRILNLCTSEEIDGRTVFTVHTLYLDSLLDELSLTYGVAPKNICKEVRGFLTLVIRTSGALATSQRTFAHSNINMHGKTRTACLSSYDFDARELMLPFFQSEAMQKEYKQGLESLTRLRMNKLKASVEIYMRTSLIKTDPDHFITFGSFLHSIMALAGYGRAMPYASAPIQGDERNEDPHQISNRIEEQILSMHQSALSNGFIPPIDDKWIPTCISYWKSTSAGVAPLNVTLTIDGKERSVKVRKKAAIGALMGRTAFKKSSLSKVTSIRDPGSVGHRDVPYKPTRSIYVVSLPTQHAQIAVASHLVNYISSKGENSGRYGLPIDPSHCTTGSGSTTGLRLVDTYDTISASGDTNILAIGTDLSSYDANLRFWNFRKAFISALKKANAGNTFGPERITGSMMVDYAFGEGRIYKSFWDNGRKPVTVVIEGKKLEQQYEKYTKDIVVGSDIDGIKPMPGTKFLRSGKHVSFDVTTCLDDGLEIPWKDLCVFVRRDGDDIVFLTSEASGELTTLTANSIVNLSMQEVAIKWLHQSEFGKYYNVLYMKGVGDDAEWIGRLTGIPSPEIINETLNGLKNLYAEMGHVFSPAKTYVMPLSAEYIQTFARYGLYIPRDQVMMIPSEKPRTVRNPIGFLDSFRQLLLTKCARGFNMDYAMTLFLWHSKEISRLTLRRHGGPADNKVLKLSVPGDVVPAVKVTPVNIKRTSSEYKDKNESITHYYHSVLTFMLPLTAGGLGFNPLALLITNTPAMFLRFIGAYSEKFSRIAYANLIFSMRLPKNDGQSTRKESSLGRVVLPTSMQKIGVADVFSSTVQHNLMKLKDINLGRSNGENVPRRILVQGLELENFMENESNYEREEFAEEYLKKTISPMKRVRHDGDEWVTSFKYQVENVKIEDMHNLTFYRGIGDEYHTLLRLYGMSWNSSRLGRSMERLRIAISRDPIMRGVSSPEEVIRLLDKFGVSNAIDFDVGFIILARAGFESSTINAILEIRLNPDNDLTPDATYGAFSDDFSATLNLYTSDALRKFDVPLGLSNAEAKMLLLYAANRSLFETYYRNLPIRVTGAILSNDGSESGVTNKLIPMPRTYRQVVSGQRSAAKLNAAMQLDLNDIIKL